MLEDVKKVSFKPFPLPQNSEKPRWAQTGFHSVNCQLQELESQAAKTDGARQELVKRLNTVRLENKVDMVAEAEEHAEGLLRAVMELQQWVFKNQLHGCSSRNELYNTTLHYRALHSATVQTMFFSNIDINAVEEAERAANQSRETADRTLEVATGCPLRCLSKIVLFFQWHVYFLKNKIKKKQKVKEEGLAYKAEGLREKSAALWTEVDETESDLECT